MKILTAFWPLIWGTSHLFCLSVLVECFGYLERSLLINGHGEEHPGSWGHTAHLLCIYFRISTFWKLLDGMSHSKSHTCHFVRFATWFLHTLRRMFNLGEINIHFGGDLGGFHCLLWGVGNGSIYLEARCCTFDSSHVFFYGDVSLS